LTIPPTLGPDCKLLEKACKKLERFAEPPVPPKSATRLSKLDCSELSALPVAVEESAEVLDNDCTRLLMSEISCEPGPEVPEEEPEEDSAAAADDVELVCDADWSAAIRLCMKA
jgi:hypothetical protein